VRPLPSDRLAPSGVQFESSHETRLRIAKFGNRAPTTTDNYDAAAPAVVGPWLQAQGSRHFLDWLMETRISPAFSMYPTAPLRGGGLRVPTSNPVCFHHCGEGGVKLLGERGNLEEL